MAKRFIDTELFNDSWFKDDLSINGKLFFVYFITKCNAGGILDFSKKTFKDSTGISDINSIFREYGSHLIPLRDNEEEFLGDFEKIIEDKLKEGVPSEESVTITEITEEEEFLETTDYLFDQEELENEENSDIFELEDE